MVKHLLYGPRRTARIETYLSLHPNDRLIEYLGKNYDSIERTIARTESMEFILGVIRQNHIRDRDGKEVTLETLEKTWQTMNTAILRGFGRQNPSPGFPDLREPVPRWRERPRYKWPVVPKGNRRRDGAATSQPTGEAGHPAGGAGEAGSDSGEPEPHPDLTPERGDGEPTD